MPGPADKARSLLATVVGYILVALVAFWLLGAVIGTLRFIIRAVLTLVLLGALLALYLKLKTPRSG